MARISDLINQVKKPFFSLEYFPPSDPAQMDKFYETADILGALKPLFVSVTYGAGGSKQDKTLAVTVELARRGYTAMAHLTCVGAEKASILSFLQNLQNNGVDNVLALRGDPPKDGSRQWEKGPFHNAKDLVAFVKKEMPQMGVGVAAYPYPHPESPTYESDRMHTAEKFANGADFAITQLFFDIREYIELCEDLKRRNINVPVIPGIITIQSFEGLKRVLSLCGANIPAKFYIELDEANMAGGADAVREAGIKFTIRQIRQAIEYGAPGVHLYTLNRSDLCKRIIEETGLA